MTRSYTLLQQDVENVKRFVFGEFTFSDALCLVEPSVFFCVNSLADSLFATHKNVTVTKKKTASPSSIRCTEMRGVSLLGLIW